MIILDVIVNNKKVDELYPKTTTIRELVQFIDQHMKNLQNQYGQHVYLNRRYVYKK